MGISGRWVNRLAARWLTLTLALSASLGLVNPSLARGTCPWDCANNNGQVDIIEFLTLIGQWGMTTACDFDGGGVGFSDFLKLLDHWGPCCTGPEDCDDGDPCTIDTCVNGECISLPAEGDCCSSTGSPGCNNPECCAIVCGADPFCCDVTWDGVCADSAADLCGDLCSGGDPSCGDADAGSCCEANGTPACDDFQCCDLICSIDPFCCDTEWDQTCANTAAVTCVGCP